MSGGDRYQKARDEVIEFLSGQYSQDVIDEAEFERRVTLANEAEHANGLVSLVVDLPDSQALINRITAPAASTAGRPPAAPSGPSWGIQTGSKGSGGGRAVVSIFSGSDLRGEWDVPETVNVLSVFGGSHIDLREARFPEGDVYIHALSVFGGTDVIVPEGVNVEVRGIGIFGGFSRPKRTQRYDNAPRIIVDGIAFFGGVDVKHPRSRHGKRYIDEED